MQQSRQARRTTRVRSSLRRSLRPRLNVYRTNQHIWAQLIDDQRGITLASASTKTLDAKKATKTEKAAMVGANIAKLALTHKVTQIVFDRGPYKYHGRVKAVAEAARQAGLQF